MLAVALALLASVSWGVGDFIAGLKSRRYAVLAVLAVVHVGELAAIGLVLAVHNRPPPPAEGLLFGFVAGFASLVGLAGLYRGIALGAITVVAPITATASVVPFVVGLAMGERPAPLQLAGALLALGGVALVARAPGGQGGRLGAGVAFAIASALGFGFFFVLFDRASEHDVYWAALMQRLAGVSVVWPAAAWRRAALPRARADLAWLLLVGALNVGGSVLFGLSSREGLVSLVAILSSLYPVVTVVLALAILRERPTPQQQAGALAALAGVGLIAAG